MSAVRTRALELTTTVTFHGVALSELESLAVKLSSAVRDVLLEYPSVTEFLIEPDPETGDIKYGLRFVSIDPAYANDMADEILEKAVELVATRDGVQPIDAEREESVLVLA